MTGLLSPHDVEVRGPLESGFDEILTSEALAFVAELESLFRGRRETILRARSDRQFFFDTGGKPKFRPDTQGIRDGDWVVDPLPEDLLDRRVEITGPVDRKMIINALNSGARVFMADFEDSTSPTWHNVVSGQIHLRDAVAGTIEFVNDQGKRYTLGSDPATLMVRPRGWHLEERHLRVNGRPVSGSLFDFGLFLFHNARALIARGTGPYFYLPKLESREEARLWNDVFVAAQERLGIPQGTIKATVLIETISAAFEMDEILYELRAHSAGLNCGRWDYIFSFIKKFRHDRECVLPDRDQVTMTTHFMRSYSRLLIQTCHRRGVHAMGGMAAQIPIKSDEVANREALARVTEDKLREVKNGHDGTWVAHPHLVPVARDIFDRHMPRANQIDNPGPAEVITAEDLLTVPAGTITEAGLRTNLRVGLQYLRAWLEGTGCVPLNHLMEDAATAEICRAQLWQWIRHPDVTLEDGRPVERDFVLTLLEEEVNTLETESGGGRLALAVEIFEQLITAESFEEFLTLPGYEHLP